MKNKKKGMEKGVLAEGWQTYRRRVNIPKVYLLNAAKLIGSIFLIDLPSILTGILIIKQRFFDSRSFAPAGRYINSPVRRGGRGKEISLRQVSPRGTIQWHLPIKKIFSQSREGAKN
jgi:hypothetical protein